MPTVLLLVMSDGFAVVSAAADDDDDNNWCWLFVVKLIILLGASLDQLHLRTTEEMGSLLVWARPLLELV